MLTRTVLIRQFRCTAWTFLIAILAALQPAVSSAQSSRFTGDTLLNITDGYLADFAIVGGEAIGLIGLRDSNNIIFTRIIRYSGTGTESDTLYSTTDRFFGFETIDGLIALGISRKSVEDEFIVATSDSGATWDTMDIRIEGYITYFHINDPTSYLIRAESPKNGWWHVNSDSAYWLFHKRWTNSWVQLLDNDSILLFAADDSCPGTYDSDSGYFRFVQSEEIVDELTSFFVPGASPPPVPPQMACPLLQLTGFDGKRIWFTRSWGTNHIDSNQVWPTALYSYDVSTGTVQYEYFFPRPDSWPRAILFADHIFVSLDSHMVVRHVDEPPGTPFITVPGVYTGLENLQVDDGALYGSRSSGLIMRISQASSVPVLNGREPALFIAEIHGNDIQVVARNGSTIFGNIPLELFDTQGRLLAESEIAAGGRLGRVPTPSAPGVYFLRCGDSDTSTILRIIVPQH